MTDIIKEIFYVDEYCMCGRCLEGLDGCQYEKVKQALAKEQKVFEEKSWEIIEGWLSGGLNPEECLRVWKGFCKAHNTELTLEDSHG